MTWYADHVFCEPREAVLAALKETWMARAVHHVVEPLAHDWYTDGIEHGLPEGGLVVVRPVAEPGAKRQGREVVSWKAYPKRDRPPWPIPGRHVRRTLDEGEQFYPPDGFLAYLSEFAAATASVVAYYQCFSWGGDVESETAWLCGDDPRVFAGRRNGNCVAFTRDGHAEKDADVLIEALRPFGLVLPSPYFALHTREFDWAPYAL